jgi:hypothetical protein
VPVGDGLSGTEQLERDVDRAALLASWDPHETVVLDERVVIDGQEYDVVRVKLRPSTWGSCF